MLHLSSSQGHILGHYHYHYHPQYSEGADALVSVGDYAALWWIPSTTNMLDVDVVVVCDDGAAAAPSQLLRTYITEYNVLAAALLYHSMV